MRFANAALLVLALVMPMSAQAPEELYAESIEVTVVSVDVFATDSSGKPILGLTREDFEIFESGTQQEITNFSEVREQIPAAPLPAQATAPLAPIPEERSRKLIFFIDAETLHPFNRNRVYEQLRGFVGTVLRPGDQAMLAVWRGGLQIEVPFTSLVSEVERSLTRLGSEGTGRSQLVLRQRETEQKIRAELSLATTPRSGITLSDAYRASISHARMYAEQIRAETRAKVVAMNGLLATLAGVEGKKAMIFVGEELATRPGVEMFQFVNETFRPSAPQSREVIIMSQPESSAPVESALFDVVGRAANANGVTVYMLSASTGLDLTESPAESREIRSTDIQFLETVNRISGFQMVASKTGGLAFSQTSNVEGVFERIERDFDTYYSLGYRLANPVTPGERGLAIRSRKPGVEIRTRTSYYAKTTREQVIDRVVATLYYDSGPGDMEIRIVSKTPRKKGRGQYLVPVDVEIPSSSLTLLPVGDRLAGKFSVFIGVSDGDGGLSRIDQKSRSISVPAGEAAKMDGKHFTYSVDLMMGRGENTLAVAVVDDVTNMKAFSRKRLDVK